MLATALVHRMTAHHTLLLAAGVAFLSALSLVPTLVVVVALYGIVASPSDVEANIGGLLEALPDSARDLVVTELELLTATSDSRLTLGLAIGLSAAAWAISTAVNSLVIAIRVAHEIPSPHNWVQGRVFALGLSVLAVLSVVTTIWLTVALPRVLDSTDVGDPVDTVLDVARWPIAIVTSAVAVAVLYRVVTGRWRGRLGISPGTACATVIWVLSTAGLGVVIDAVDRLQSTFSTLGAVAGLLIWFYFSAVAVLIGAELDGATHDQGAPVDDRPSA